MFLLSSPAWPLPIYSDLWTWCSRFQCKIVLCSIRFYFHPWTYPLLSIFFASSFFLELFLCSSPTAYQTPSDLGGSSSGVIFFVFSYRSWSSWGENTGVVCHSLLQWTRFCQNSWLWAVCLGWPCMAWRIASLTCTSPFAMSRWWTMKGKTYYIPPLGCTLLQTNKQ